MAICYRIATREHRNIDWHVAGFRFAFFAWRAFHPAATIAHDAATCHNLPKPAAANSCACNCSIDWL
jgi:hypothetical protein